MSQEFRDAFYEILKWLLVLGVGVTGWYVRGQDSRIRALEIIVQNFAIEKEKQINQDDKNLSALQTMFTKELNNINIILTELKIKILQNDGRKTG